MNNYQVWIKENGEFRVFEYATKVIQSYLKLPQGINSFYVPKNYSIDGENTDDCLLRYAELLLADRNELLNCKTLKVKFDYFDNTYKVGNEVKIFYKTHTNCVTTLFKMLTKKDKYYHFDDITLEEHKWFNKCYNGGLMYLKAPGEYDCYGFDFKMYYPSILASKDFKIPTKIGKEKTINKLPKHLQFGFYRVNIISNDERVKRIFAFSKHNVYTNELLKFARELSEKYELSINLITDGEPNAYVYEQKDLVTGDTIFQNWYDRLVELKAELPNNKIIKLLASSLWGHLSECNTLYKTEQEIIDENLSVGVTEKSKYVIHDMVDNGRYCYYELLDTSKKIYKYNLRLKPFITGFGRIKTAKVIEDNNLGDNVIRIQTDGIVFTESFSSGTQNFVEDKKTSGKIIFNNVNNYNKIN